MIAYYREFGQWFRVELDGPFLEGEESTGKMTFPGYEGAPWKAMVVAMETNRRFSFRWHHGDQEVDGWTSVEFLLNLADNGTELSVQETGFDLLPQRDQLRILRSNEQGWEIQFQNLRSFAEGESAYTR